MEYKLFQHLEERIKFFTNSTRRFNLNISVKFIFYNREMQGLPTGSLYIDILYSFVALCLCRTFNTNCSLFILYSNSQRCTKYSIDWKPSTWELCHNFKLCHINRRHAWRYTSNLYVAYTWNIIPQKFEILSIFE